MELSRALGMEDILESIFCILKKYTFLRTVTSEQSPKRKRNEQCRILEAKHSREKEQQWYK